jgi:hypothetical protein
MPKVEPPEPTRLGEVVWLEPFPDALLDEGAIVKRARVSLQSRRQPPAAERDPAPAPATFHEQSTTLVVDAVGFGGTYWIGVGALPRARLTV